MTWRVKVTGSGVVAANRGDGQETQIPHGEYEMTMRPDGRYKIVGEAGSYILSAPDQIGAEGYIDDKVADGTIQILKGDWQL